MKLYDFSKDEVPELLVISRGFDLCYRGQEAERKFALNLLELYKNVKRAVNLHEDLSHPELTVGRFGGIHVSTFIYHFFCVFFPFHFHSLRFDI